MSSDVPVSAGTPMGELPPAPALVPAANTEVPPLTRFVNELMARYPASLLAKYSLAKPATEFRDGKSSYVGPAIKTEIRAMGVQHFEVRAVPVDEVLASFQSPNGPTAYYAALEVAETRGLPWRRSGSGDYFDPGTRTMWSDHIVKPETIPPLPQTTSAPPPAPRVAPPPDLMVERLKRHMPQGLAVAIVNSGILKEPEASKCAEFVEDQILAVGHGVKAAAAILSAMPYAAHKPVMEKLSANLVTNGSSGDLFDLLQCEVLAPDLRSNVLARTLKCSPSLHEDFTASERGCFREAVQCRIASWDAERRLEKALAERLGEPEAEYPTHDVVEAYAVPLETPVDAGGYMPQDLDRALRTICVNKIVRDHEPTIVVAPGTKGIMDGFQATVVGHYSGNMYNIRMPGGEACCDISGFKPASQNSETPIGELPPAPQPRYAEGERDKLRSFTLLIARMTTDEEMDGAMSGDDAVTALGNLIATARDLVNQPIEPANEMGVSRDLLNRIVDALEWASKEAKDAASYCTDPSDVESLENRAKDYSSLLAAIRSMEQPKMASEQPKREQSLESLRRGLESFYEAASGSSAFDGNARLRETAYRARLAYAELDGNQEDIAYWKDRLNEDFGMEEDL
jgi:hypothetical protein